MMNTFHEYQSSFRDKEYIRKIPPVHPCACALAKAVGTLQTPRETFS